MYQGSGQNHVYGAVQGQEKGRPVWTSMSRSLNITNWPSGSTYMTVSHLHKESSVDGAKPSRASHWAWSSDVYRGLTSQHSVWHFSGTVEEHVCLVTHRTTLHVQESSSPVLSHQLLRSVFSAHQYSTCRIQHNKINKIWINARTSHTFSCLCSRPSVK